MQVLDLQEHHSLLTLSLRAQLLHLNVDVTVDLLEEKYILRVEIRSRALNLRLHILKLCGTALLKGAWHWHVLHSRGGR